MVFIYGIIFVFILGTIGHFLYQICNNKIIGFIFSKSESIWEHLKLGITPIIIWSLIEKSKLPNIKYFYSITGYQITIYSLSIIVLYIVYRLIFKKRNTIYDILTFYISVIISFITKFLLVNMISIPIVVIILGYILFLLNIIAYFYLNNTKRKLWIKKEPIQEKGN